jgi:hypothetical protein
LKQKIKLKLSHHDDERVVEVFSGGELLGELDSHSLRECLDAIVGGAAEVPTEPKALRLIDRIVEEP